MSKVKESTHSPIDANQKRAYFVRLGLQARRELSLHREVGLWKRVDGKRDWGNVSEHCLVEVARASVLSDALGLPQRTKEGLMRAAALHDFYKKREREILEARGLSWEAYDESEKEAKAKLKDAHFSRRVNSLAAGSTGHSSLMETEKLLAKKKLIPDEVAFLAMHYIDDYTVNAEWVTPAKEASNGKTTNDLDTRMERNRANQRYKNINEEGLVHIGERAYDAQQRIGHLVEERLTSLIQANTGKQIDPIRLPEFIDEGVKNAISNYPQVPVFSELYMEYLNYFCE